MVKKLDKHGFEEALKTSGKPVVVDFATDWCPYCKRLAPIIEEVAGEHADEIEVYYVNTDEHQDIAEKYNIMTVPSVFVFKNGEIVRNAVNPKTKEALVNLIFND